MRHQSSREGSWRVDAHPVAVRAVKAGSFQSVGLEINGSSPTLSVEWKGGCWGQSGRFPTFGEVAATMEVKRFLASVVEILAKIESAGALVAPRIAPNGETLR